MSLDDLKQDHSDPEQLFYAGQLGVLDEAEERIEGMFVGGEGKYQQGFRDAIEFALEHIKDVADEVKATIPEDMKDQFNYLNLWNQ